MKVGLMDLNLATLKARTLKDQSKCVHLPGEPSNLDVGAEQETHFIYAANSGRWRMTTLAF